MNFDKEFKFSEIPKFPQVQRDLSLVMNKDVKYNDVISVIDLNKNKILKKVSLYDIYEGDSIGSNRIAYSMRFILQDESKTLGEKEINSTMDILIKVFEEELNKLFPRSVNTIYSNFSDEECFDVLAVDQFLDRKWIASKIQPKKIIQGNFCLLYTSPSPRDS